MIMQRLKFEILKDVNIQNSRAEYTEIIKVHDKANNSDRACNAEVEINLMVCFGV